MAKLTPMMIKKKKMEEALAGKKSNDSKLLFQDAEDDSGSEDDHEDDVDDLEDDSDDIEMEGDDDDDDEDDDEDDEDDDETPELVTKQAKKGAAAKQQTPMKMERKTPQKLAKTPLAKTPMKGQTPVVAKQGKQTPVVAKKGKQMEDDDEEDEDDDDEEMASDDDDDEEEDESSEGDEAEEEDDEEENGDVKKGGKKRPAEDDIVRSPKKVKMTFECSNQEILAQYERLVEIDSRSLFIRFQSGLNAEQIQAMSPDIKSVIVYNTGSGVISFDSEAIAEKNMKVLRSKSNDSNGLEVSYNGAKNGRQPFMGQKNVFALDRSKLTVQGLPDNASADELKKAFPKCAKAEVNNNRGYVRFSSEEDCKDAFESSSDLSIGGRKVGVVYSYVTIPGFGNEKSGHFSPRGRGRGRGTFNGSDGFRGGRGRGGFRGGRGRGGGEGFRGGRGRGDFRGGRGQRGGGFRGGRGRVVADN